MESAFEACYIKSPSKEKQNIQKIFHGDFIVQII